MAKGTDLSEFEKGEITVLKRVGNFERNFEGLRMQQNCYLQLLEKSK